MIAASALTAITALFCCGTNADLVTSVRSEGQAGVQSATTGALVSSDVEIAPSLQLTISNARSNAAVSYRPLIFVLVPASFFQGPLLLHQANANADWRVSRRWYVSGGAYVTAGDLLYNRALEIFDPQQPITSTLPNTDVLSYINAGANAHIRAQTSRRGSVSVTAYLSLNRSFADRQAGSLPDQQRSIVFATYNRVLSRLDTARLELRSDAIVFMPGADFHSLAVRAGLRRRLNANYSIGANLGLQRNGRMDRMWIINETRLRADDELAVPYYPWIPLLEINAMQRSQLVLGTRVETSASASLASSTDISRSTIEPRAALFVSSQADIAPAYRARVQLYFSTPVTEAWVPAPVANASMHPTLLAAQASLSYKGIKDIELEAGVRTYCHASHLREARLELGQFGANAYIAMLASWDTGL